MSKKVLYILILALVAYIIWLQWLQPQPTIAPVEEELAEEIDTERTVTPAAREASEQEEEVIDEAVERVVVSGTYVGLRDTVGGQFEETSTFLLLDDGTEIVSIDLAPLIGTQKTGIESELGITRGDRLELQGDLMNDSFEVRAIEVVGE